MRLLRAQTLFEHAERIYLQLVQTRSEHAQAQREMEAARRRKEEQAKEVDALRRTWQELLAGPPVSSGQ